MELSFSTNAFTRHPLAGAIETITAAGYAGVEILADRPHLYPPTAGAGEVEEIKEVLRRTALAVANLNANTAVGYYGRDFWEPLFEPSLANPDPEARAWRLDYTRRAIDLAASLGSTCVSITSGRPVPGILPAESLGLFRQALEVLLPYAAERNIRLGIEYEPGLIVEGYEEAAALIEELGSPFLGLNLDMGHSYLLGEDLSAVFGRLPGRVFHVHLEDIRGRKHYHLIPGLGDMDMPGIFAALKRFDYQGFVTVELYTYPDRPAEAARRALAHLQPFFRRQDGVA